MRIKRWGNRWSDEGKHQHIKKWKNVTIKKQMTKRQEMLKKISKYVTKMNERKKNLLSAIFSSCSFSCFCYSGFPSLLHSLIPLHYLASSLTLSCPVGCPFSAGEKCGAKRHFPVTFTNLFNLLSAKITAIP